uniref:N-acetyltransferase domain-containing protein n=1 Tax=Lygus hesperus TaxID=30085 RepID=A0A146KR14_LYGHE
MKIKTRVMSEEDLELADDFIARNFYIDEPIVLANDIPFTPKGLNKLFLRQGASIVANDDETGSVVGMAINDTENKERRCYTLSEDDKKFQHMFEHMEDMSDVHNVAPDAIEIRYLAVDKAWRGRGIAQAIVEASMEAARQGGFRWFKMYTTSYFSNLLMIKMKWKRLYSLSYKEYVSEFKSDIKIPAEPHTHCNLYIYDLMSEEPN